MKFTNHLKMKTMKKYILSLITITALSICFSGTLTAQDVPLYLSSVIENLTPARLDITYDLSLANIVPASSAFTVRVNAVTRSINSITISGNNVQLTLSAPVVYGDVITFSYTRPATNPLQTSSGGLAASLTPQNVTNNVAAGIFDLPSVGTSVVTAIASTSATIAGNVISDGGAPVTARGICWNTSGSPTISDNHTSDGTGTGSFTSLMTGLVPNTTYYVRAYATNGEGTAYGPELSFNTCPAPPTVGTITQPTCEVATGSVALTDLPIRGMFQWTITMAPGETTITGFGSNTTITDLVPGYYYFTVTMLGCSSRASASVIIDPQPATPTATISDPITVCKGATNPSITFTGVGGTPPYTFSYGFNDRGPFNVTTGEGNSSVDVDVPLETADYFDYRIWSVTDANGCSRTGLNLGTTVTVASATISTGDATLITTGSAGLNGTVDANNFSADISFEYGLTPAYGNSVVATPGVVTGTEVTTVSANVTGLEANTLYHFRVVASIQECLSYGEDLTFTTPCPPITPTISVTNVSCFGQATGSINLSVAGGLAPYNYLWSNEATTEDLNLLSAGTYSVIVTDANGCTVNASADVTQPAAPLGTTFGVQNVLCYGRSTGEIYMNVTGGTPPYTYLWNTGATTEDLSDLATGTYTLTITDDNGCTNDTIVNVRQPDILNATVTSSDVTCYDSYTGTINLLNPTGGTAGGVSGYEWGYQYSIDNGANWISPGSFTNLYAGLYNVLIRDTEITSCIVTLVNDLEITEPEMLSATVSSTDVTCFEGNDGSITISNPQGGHESYEFSIEGEGGWGDIAEFSNLPAGHYRIRIRDAEFPSCEIELQEDLIIAQPVEINVVETITNVSCNTCKDGAIDISVTGGTGGYIFAWTGPDGFTSVAEDLIALESGLYNLTITDASNCISERTYEVFSPFIVTNTNDDGMGSLRYAMQYADVRHTVTPDLITFNIPGTGPFVIQPLTPLPIIADPVVIDGYTQPGTTRASTDTPANLLIEVDGINLPESSGFLVTCGHSKFSGLIITGFGIDGIQLVYGSSNIVVGNYIGVDAAGQAKVNLTGALRIAASPDNIIGGLEPENRNVMAAGPNGGSYLIFMLLPETTNNSIIGNYLGVGPDGTTKLGESKIGIQLNEGSHHNTIGPKNVISGNSEAGIRLQPIHPNYPNNNRIIGNYIGTDKTGNNAIGNNNGIELFSAFENIIGGTSPEERNIISGNTRNGIAIYFDSNNRSTGNIIQGNYIGLNASGTQAIKNDASGIEILATDNVIGGSFEGAGNVISGNGENGIYFGPGGNENKIAGNLIGTDFTGTMNLGNAQAGISMNFCSNNIVGGITTGDRNIISGNHNGIFLMESAETTISGNYVGLDISGKSSLGNNNTGIFISESHRNEIGGTDPNVRNVISSNNGDGIFIGYSSSENIIKGNFIGVDASGVNPMGNQACGIVFSRGFNNTIGGTEKDDGNMIAFNQYSGIVCVDAAYPQTGNAILSNSIHSNGKLGIDLSGGVEDSYGVTSNDETGDGDTGPNNLQNYPVLRSLRFSQGNVTIIGSLNSIAGTEYLLQFFANKLGDDSKYGEGQKYIGSAKVLTDASGNATFSETFPVYSSWGDTFTATATDPGGSTSEFSKAIGGLKEQVVADADSLHYSINKDGLPRVPETSTLDIDAINAAFKTWTDVTTSKVEFISDGTTDLKYAGIDSVNLVSFVDDQFDFGEGVLAIVAKTTEVDENDVQIRIIDADIIFNPDWINKPENNFGVGNDGQYGGFYDIQSVATHEIGHVFGLIHSGIPGSTMFFTLGTGTFVRTLANDDIAWAGYRYPESNYNSTFGSISGKITYGYSPVDDPQPVAGALIKAVNTDPNIKYKVHSYSDADGTYLVPGLIPGTYDIFIEPLDGDVGGFNLKPQNISDYLVDHTVYTDYPGEFYNLNDASEEADNYKTSIPVSAGITTTGNDIITNKDNTHPYVVSVSPADTILDFDIVKDITIKFSEAIDINTLTNETCYLEYSDGINTVKHYGDLTPIGNGTNIILFNPNSVLKYGTYYTLYVTQGVKDLKENSLVVMSDGVPKEESFMSTFTTIAADDEAPEITYVIPADTAKNVFVTEQVKLAFSEPMDKPSVEAAFALTWDEGTPDVLHEVEGSWQWDNNSMIMTYAPLRSLSEATEYTVTVSETAEDLGGNNLAAARSFTFKTVPSSPPQIIYLGPADAARGVTVETPVVVDFSEPVNPETVSTATFRLSPTGGNQVPGTFKFLNDNSRVVFRPDANLSFNTSYNIEITTGVEDMSQPAVGMEVASTTTFTTASQITTPHIRYLEPSAGITGSVVLISGFGFDPDPANNKVTFNGIQTYVKNATLTELTTTVPNGVMSGPVSVTVNSVVSDNTMHFDVIPESLDPCSDVIANTSTKTQTTHDVDIRADCAYAYVTNPDDNSVSVVDLDPSNPQVVASIPVGRTPMKIDIDPLGTKAYVTNYNSHDVSVIDISDDNGALAKVVKTIKVGIEPYGVAVTPDGKRVYVANHYSENLSIIDVDPTSGGFDHVVANVSTGSGTKSVAITGECALAVVTGDFGVKIVNADPEDPGYNSVIATVSSGTKTREVDISGEAGLAIVTTEEGNLLVINLYPEGGDYSDAVVANVPTGTKVSDVKISGECMFVYVTDTQNGNVLVYKFTQTGTGIPDGSYIAGLTLELHNTIEVGTSPMGLAIDDKAERLFITDGDNLGRRVTEIRICCGPITPATELSELIMIIQNLITYGGIKESQGNTLIRKCNAALANIYGGKPKSAINNLNDFINTVKDYMAGGKISRDQGNELIARAKAIIAMLKLTKSAETGLLLDDFDKFVNEEDLVSESGLGLIYPNPFSESVVINYEVAADDPGAAKVLIRIFDMSGRLIGTLVT